MISLHGLKQKFFDVFLIAHAQLNSAPQKNSEVGTRRNQQAQHATFQAGILLMAAPQHWFKQVSPCFTIPVAPFTMTSSSKPQSVPVGWGNDGFPPIRSRNNSRSKPSLAAQPPQFGQAILLGNTCVSHVYDLCVYMWESSGWAQQDMAYGSCTQLCVVLKVALSQSISAPKRKTSQNVW